MELFNIGLTEVPVSVKPNNRLKTRRLSVGPNGVLVEGPENSLTSVSAFLEAKSSWIFTEWQKHKGIIRHSPWPEEFTTGAKVLHLGRFTPITVISGGTDLSISDRGDWFEVRSPSGITQTQANQIIKDEFIDLFSNLILKLAVEFSTAHGFEGLRFKVTQRKDRWAYCGEDGTITLGWDLIFMPKPVIEYVVLHELVHSKIMNHGKRFWSALGSYLPDWRERTNELREFEKRYQLGE